LLENQKKMYEGYEEKVKERQGELEAKLEELEQVVVVSGLSKKKFKACAEVAFTPKNDE